MEEYSPQGGGPLVPLARALVDAQPNHYDPDALRFKVLLENISRIFTFIQVLERLRSITSKLWKLFHKSNVNDVLKLLLLNYYLDDRVTKSSTIYYYYYSINYHIICP